MKQNEKTKSIPKPQKKDAGTIGTRLTKTQTTMKGQASEDASYLTKDQLSKILMSLTSADVQTLNSTPSHQQHSQGMSIDCDYFNSIHFFVVYQIKQQTLAHSNKSKAYTFKHFPVIQNYTWTPRSYKREEQFSEVTPVERLWKFDQFFDRTY